MYGCHEEVNEIVLQLGSGPSSPQRKKLKVSATCSESWHRKMLDDNDDDINLYTRVQLADVRFRLAHPVSKNPSAHLLLLGTDHIENKEQLAEYLASESGLSREECLRSLLDCHKCLWTCLAQPRPHLESRLHDVRIISLMTGLFTLNFGSASGVMC